MNAASFAAWIGKQVRVIETKDRFLIPVAHVYQFREIKEKAEQFGLPHSPLIEWRSGIGYCFELFKNVPGNTPG